MSVTGVLGQGETGFASRRSSQASRRFTADEVELIADTQQELKLAAKKR